MPTVPPGVLFALLNVSPGVLLALLLAILAVGLLVLGLVRPAVGRFVARVVAVVAMGLGVGCLVWGVVAGARGEQPPDTGPLAGTSYSLVIGCGAGFLTGGIVALVLSCLGGEPPCSPGNKPRRVRGEARASRAGAG